MHDARMPYVLWPDADAISLLAMHHLTHRVRKDEQVCQRMHGLQGNAACRMWHATKHGVQVWGMFTVMATAICCFY